MHCAIIWDKITSGESTTLTCGWLIKAVTQKLGIFEMSSERFLKWGCLNWLYLCSTLRISSLACSFSLSISFCTSSIFSIASCCSLSAAMSRMGIWLLNKFSVIFLSYFNMTKLWITFFQFTSIKSLLKLMFGSHICQKLIKLSGRPAVHSGTRIYYFLFSARAWIHFSCTI